MEQHPIPQNISSYEFRLVGDMTLKQFLQLAGGLFVGYVIYRLPLPTVIRYPLVFTAVVVGITLAFVPINGRPFARYIWAFLMAIYSPTEFIWRPTTANTQASIATPVPNTTPVSPEPSPAAQSDHPVVDSAPVIQAIPIDSYSVSAPTQTSTSVFSSESVSTTQPETKTDPEPAPDPIPAPPTPVPEESQTIFTAPTEETPVASPLSPTAEIGLSAPLPPIAPVTGDKPNFTSLIVTPEQPNIITGLITTAEGNSIENAIIEIIDSATGIPARALRSNRLGQFQIATPLTPGAYIVQTEKDGLQFSPVRVEANGTIIEPLIIMPVA